MWRISPINLVANSVELPQLSLRSTPILPPIFSDRDNNSVGFCSGVTTGGSQCTPEPVVAAV